MLGIYCRTSILKEEETISQQKDAGLAFAKTNGFEAKVYADEGISGYKIEDEENPFKNRPAFEEMLSDIKAGIITDVWVWHPTRLSRNNQYFVSILSYFEKNKITLWVQNTRHEVTDPATKAMLGMMGVFAEFDRQTIIMNTHRGQIKSFNNGKNRYSNLFGYKSERDGKNISTFPVPEELETVRLIFDLYLKEHQTLGIIGQKAFIKNKKDLPNSYVVARAKAVLHQFVYTSYSLTVPGRKILKDFRAGLIPDLQDLRKEEFWVKSQIYKEKIITREEWILTNERLQNIREKIAEHNKGKIRERETSLSTGFLVCADCSKIKYYYKDLKKKGGLSYVHLRNYKNCSNVSQFRMDKIDTIIDVYYVLRYLILDNRKEQLEKNKTEVTEQKKEANEKLKSLMTERDKKTKRMEKVEESLDSGEIENINVVLKQLDRLTTERAGIENEIAETEALLQILSKREVDLQNVEKYNLSTMDLLRHWFELREQKNYAELHRLLRESLEGETIKIRNNIIGVRGVYFNPKNDYKIIYPFIEELLGIKINTSYSEFEQIWIDAHQKEIKEFPAKVNEYLNAEKYGRKIDFEDFALNFVPQFATGKFTKVMSVKEPEPDFKFLTCCFNPERYGAGIGLWTAPETELINVKYYCASQVAERLGIRVGSVREYGKAHGILVRDKNRQFWTEEDIQQYIAERQKKTLGIPDTRQNKHSKK